MGDNEDRRVYKNTRVIKNYREMIEYSTQNFAKNVAYVWKKDKDSKEVVYEERTYEQVGKDIKSFSTELLNRGFENKKIVLIGNNRYEWCITYLAVTSGNMVIVPMDKALPENEIENLVTRSEADVAVFDKKYLEVMKKLKKSTTANLNILICMDDVKEAEVENFADLLKNGENLLKNRNDKYDKISINPEKMSVMLFTSGTTDQPKAVMLSQKNICSNLSDFASWVKLYPTDTLLSFLPIHHTFECTVTFLYGFYSGCKVAFCDGLKYIQKNLTEYKVSVFVAVPLVLETMYKKILKAIKDQGKENLINTMTKISNGFLKCKIDLRKIIFKQILDNFGGNLRVVLYGAAAMNKDTIVGFNNFGIELVQGYGLTETSPVIAAETDKEKMPGSVGLALPSLNVKIEKPDENGEGEILVKGPSVMLGYYNNEKENEKAFEDGWFKTGDYGYIDSKGYIYVTGRKKDIIVLRNGKNVYPQEIEFLINKVPYISESMVYQREKSNTDTMLCAKIVYDKDIIKEQLGDKKEEEYKELIWEKIKEINKELPVFKHIKNITITTEPLIKTTTQKVKRYEELKKV